MTTGFQWPPPGRASLFVRTIKTISHISPALDLGWPLPLDKEANFRPLRPLLYRCLHETRGGGRSRFFGDVSCSPVYNWFPWLPIKSTQSL